MRTEESIPVTQAHGGVFATTHWSVVLTAGRDELPEAHAALEQLCRTYWYAIYAYVRRHGSSPEDAQDLTQDFFAHMLANEFPRGATPERGKFRSFLLASLRHFLVDQHRHDSAVKRGGGRRLLSFDDGDAEARFPLEPPDERTPETVFQRAWAMSLLECAQSRLRQEYVAAGRGDLYERLKGFRLMEKPDGPLAEAATEFGMTVSALKSAVHRLRARYRQLVRDEIAQTVADPAELREEARHLIAVVSS